MKAFELRRREKRTMESKEEGSSKKIDKGKRKLKREPKKPKTAPLELDEEDPYDIDTIFNAIEYHEALERIAYPCAKIYLPTIKMLLNKLL